MNFLAIPRPNTSPPVSPLGPRGSTDRSCRGCCPAGRGSWTRCCWGARTRGCRAAGCPPGTAPGTGCPGSSPASTTQPHPPRLQQKKPNRQVGLKVMGTNVSEVNRTQLMVKSSRVIYSQNQHQQRV